MVNKNIIGKNNLKLLALIFIFLNFLLLSWISFSRGNFFYEHFENFDSYKLSLLLWAFIFLLFSYGLLIFKVRDGISKWDRIIIVLIIIIAFATPPFLSRDVGAYLIGAKNFAWFHVNPYLYNLDVVRDNLWVKELGAVWWTNQPFAYGPIFLLVASISVSPNFLHLISAVFFYKIIILSAYICSIFIFYKIIRFLRYDNFLVIIFTLNPAILVNGVVDGHNEVFIILTILLLIYFFTTERIGKSYLLWACSILIKYNTLIFLPIFWKKNGKFSRKNIIFSTLGIAILVMLFFLIFNLGKNGIMESLVFLKNQQRCLYQCSPAISILNILGGGESGLLRFFLFSIFYIVIFYKFLVKQDNILKFTFWSFFCLMFIFTKWMTPWYPIVIIPIGILIREDKYDFLVMGITAYSLLHFFGVF